jgi:hypothetical protein
MQIFSILLIFREIFRFSHFKRKIKDLFKVQFIPYEIYYNLFFYNKIIDRSTKKFFIIFKFLSIIKSISILDFYYYTYHFHYHL